MASLTPRFKLNYFGAGVSGSLTDDGLKFTGLDRMTIDRALAGLENADHHYHPRTSSSATAPTAVLSDTGALAPGTTYYYRTTFVDSAGLETIAGPEVSVATPATLQRPSGLTGNTVPGGYLPDALYYYALTSTRGTEESTLSDAVTVRTVGGDNTVVLNIPALINGTGVKVWRMADSETAYSLIGTAGPATTFTDAGFPSDPCACLPGKVPPSTSRGSYIYSVTITLNTADAPKLAASSGYTAWRLYRTTTSGTYGSQSLVAQIVERDDEFDMSTPLVNSYTDLGTALLAGTPPVADLSLNIAPYTIEQVTTLPEVAPYPEGYPLLVSGALYVKIGGAWKAFSGANILSGSLPPTSDVGSTGDLYVQTGATPALWGPKSATGWTLLTSLTRPTILNGVGAPLSTQGADNDFYFDKTAVALYGPKDGVWPARPITLGGSSGAGILSGSRVPTLNDGVTGQYYIWLKTETNNNVSQVVAYLYGPKTDLGWPTDPTYLAGVPGPPGIDGSNGLDGAPGEPGPPLRVLGSVPTLAGLPTEGTPGDAYFVGEDLYVFTQNNGWVNTGHTQALDSSRRLATLQLDTLVVNAETMTTMPLAVGYRLMRIATTGPARVRLYTRAAAQSADQERLVGIDPVGNHGVVLDVVTTPSMLSLDLAPQVYGASMEDIPSTSIPITVANSGSTTGVGVTLTYVRTE